MLHVRAPGGDIDGVALEGEAEAQEDVAHGGLVDVGAEQGVDLLGLELDGGLLEFVRADVDDALHHLARAEQLDELAGALHGGVGVLGVEALFIAGGGVGAHAEGGGGAADGGAVEVGGLKEHHGGVAHDLGVGAAHDAGHAHGLFRVADAEHGGGQLALGAVESLDGLALSGAAHMDLAALDAGEVKGVHGLAVLEHDVVGDVDDVVDGAHAGVADTLAHPGGGRGDLHVFDHAGGVAHAEGVLDEDLGQLVDVAAGRGLDHGLMQLELLVEGDGGLAGKADHAQAVGAVRGDLKLHHMVVQTQERAHVVAGLAVLMQDEDAVGDAVGKLLLLGVQIVGGEDGASSWYHRPPDRPRAGSGSRTQAPHPRCPRPAPCPRG